MTNAHGYRRGTRYMFARAFRHRGYIPLSTYMRVYKRGDFVSIKVFYFKIFICLLIYRFIFHINKFEPYRAQAQFKRACLTKSITDELVACLMSHHMRSASQSTSVSSTFFSVDCTEWTHFLPVMRITSHESFPSIYAPCSYCERSTFTCLLKEHWMCCAAQESNHREANPRSRRARAAEPCARAPP